jgi:hypothetical protein
MYALGGSLAVFAAADISLSSVNDRSSFTSIDVAQNALYFNSSASLGVHSFSEFLMNSVGGSLYISSRVSVALTSVSLVACSAITKYDGRSSPEIDVATAAIGGAATLLSNQNPFLVPEFREFYRKPSLISMISVIFSGNTAMCIRNLPSNSSNSSKASALGGAVSMLQSNSFSTKDNTVQANHDRLISIVGSSFSNNNASVVFPRSSQTHGSPLNISTVVLGGSL